MPFKFVQVKELENKSLAKESLNHKNSTIQDIINELHQKTKNN